MSPALPLVLELCARKALTVHGRDTLLWTPHAFTCWIFLLLWCVLNSKAPRSTMTGWCASRCLELISVFH
ncbi:hypothetical protein NQZ68_008603 [Dissostichus eleginoides]|nr:hypothetical protein NQZ68_008603 [Dissostichus eleginoides]